jgi:hypothetical protein
MKAASATFSMEEPKAYRAILWGGLIAGTMDITAACVNSALRGGRGPIGVMQSVASGLLGANAFNGGLGAAALGLACHFFIAFVATTVYYIASRQLKLLTQQAIVCGVLYGIAVYFFMYFVVIPLSAAPFKIKYTITVLATGLLIHIFCIGLPIALAVRRYSK